MSCAYCAPKSTTKTVRRVVTSLIVVPLTRTLKTDPSYKKSIVLLVQIRCVFRHDPAPESLFDGVRWHDGGVNIRQILTTALLAIALALGVGLVSASTAYATTPPADTQQEIQTDTQPPTTENDFMNLERDVTSCISSSPQPGCGREPTSSSDRGGWQQLLLFFIMFLGMAFIFWRVFLSVRARDRNLN